MDVKVLEEHDEALWYLKKIYEKDLQPRTLIHVDSHSDMDLKEFFDLGSYILKGAYLGFIDEIVWVKHSFCREFEEGEYQFSVGNNESGDLVCSLNHPVFRKVYSSIDDITENEREILFHVCDIENAETISLKKGNEGVFDLDLDFFGANNVLHHPLAQSIGEEEYQLLRGKILNCYKKIEDIEAIEREYLSQGKNGVVKFANIFAGALVFPDFKLDHDEVKDLCRRLKNLLTKTQPAHIFMCKSQSSGYLNVDNPEVFVAKIENFLKLWNKK